MRGIIWNLSKTNRETSENMVGLGGLRSSKRRQCWGWRLKQCHSCAVTLYSGLFMVSSMSFSLLTLFEMLRDWTGKINFISTAPVIWYSTFSLFLFSRCFSTRKPLISWETLSVMSFRAAVKDTSQGTALARRTVYVIFFSGWLLKAHHTFSCL